MEGLGGRFLDCPDHPFGLAVGPWMIRLGKAMLDAVVLAGATENVANPRVRHALVPIDELHTVVGQDGVDRSKRPTKAV